MKIGLIREGKIPPDKRVPFTPLQTEEIEQRFAHTKVVCQQKRSRVASKMANIRRSISKSNPMCLIATS